MPLTHSVFVSWVKKLTGQAGILSSGYDGHNFWEVAAFPSLLCGRPEALFTELRGPGIARCIRRVYLGMPLFQSWPYTAGGQFLAMAAGELGAELLPSVAT